jgi:hypothetical protein
MGHPTCGSMAAAVATCVETDHSSVMSVRGFLLAIENCRECHDYSVAVVIPRQFWSAMALHVLWLREDKSYGCLKQMM